MKKGQTESYSFLIGVVLTVLILTAVGCAVYQIFKPKGVDYMEDLSETIEDLKKKGDSVAGELPFFVEEDEILLAFSKNQEYIGKKGWRSIFQWECYGIKFAWGIYTPFGVTGNIERPEKLCPIDKSCLCVCEISTAIIPGTTVSLSPKRVTQDACKGPKVECKTFDDFTFVGGKGCFQGVFIPGGKAGTLGYEERKLDTLYYAYSKEGNYVSIDDEEAWSIEKLKSKYEEQKEEFEEELATGYFDYFSEKVKECEGKDDCNCGQIVDLKNITQSYKLRLANYEQFGSPTDAIIELIKIEGGNVESSQKIWSKMGILCHKRTSDTEEKLFKECGDVYLNFDSLDFTNRVCCSLEGWEGQEDKQPDIFLLNKDSKVFLSTKTEGLPLCQ